MSCAESLTCLTYYGRGILRSTLSHIIQPFLDISSKRLELPLFSRIVLNEKMQSLPHNFSGIAVRATSCFALNLTLQVF
jgi:hypothetical protein